jgi:exonuclease VII small subunit
MQSGTSISWERAESVTEQLRDAAIQYVGPETPNNIPVIDASTMVDLIKQNEKIQRVAAQLERHIYALENAHQRWQRADARTKARHLALRLSSRLDAISKRLKDAATIPNPESNE